MSTVLMNLTDYHAKYFAYELTKRCPSDSADQVVANWLIGREIVEEEQRGKRRAGYGEKLLAELSVRLTKDVGKGWSVRNLECCCNFYLEYPLLLTGQKANAPSSISSKASSFHSRQISNAVRAESFAPLGSGIPHAERVESWHPGQLHSNQSWAHYRTLLRVDKAGARAFYEIESIIQRELRSLSTEVTEETLPAKKRGKGKMDHRFW